MGKAQGILRGSCHLCALGGEQLFHRRSIHRNDANERVWQVGEVGHQAMKILAFESIEHSLLRQSQALSRNWIKQIVSILA